MYVFSSFPFDSESRIWDLIISVPDHCLSFFFAEINGSKKSYTLVNAIIHVSTNNIHGADVTSNYSVCTMGYSNGVLFIFTYEKQILYFQII